MKAEVVIEDAVAKQLKKFADASHISFTEAISKAIHAGVSHLQSEEPTQVVRAKELQAEVERLKEIDFQMEVERYRRAGK